MLRHPASMSWSQSGFEAQSRRSGGSVPVSENSAIFRLTSGSFIQNGVPLEGLHLPPNVWLVEFRRLCAAGTLG
jgi:hypothetical protein